MTAPKAPMSGQWVSTYRVRVMQLATTKTRLLTVGLLSALHGFAGFATVSVGAEWPDLNELEEQFSPPLVRTGSLGDLLAEPVMTASEFFSQKKSGLQVISLRGLVSQKKPNRASSAKSSSISEKEATVVTLSIDHLGNPSPSSITLADSETLIRVDLSERLVVSNVFVRDPDLLTWNSETLVMSPEKSGVSEIYIVADSKMVIVPIKIGEPQDQYLSIPRALTSLNAKLLQSRDASASIATRVSASTPEAGGNSEQMQESTAEGSLKRAEKRKVSTTQGEQPTIELINARIQVVDERSDVYGAKLFPVPGAVVYVHGVEGSFEANARGILEIRGVPNGADVMVEVSHPQNVVRRQYAHVRLSGEIAKVVVLRSSVFDLMSRSVGQPEQSYRGSLCATVFDQNDGGSRAERITASIDREASGPFYFGDHGLINARRSHSGQDGRLCFFNVEPGPAYVTLTQGETSTAMTVMVFEESHVEHEFDLGIVHSERLTVRALPTAHELLAGDSVMAQTFRPVDYLEAYLPGQESELEYRGGALVTGDDLIAASDRRSDLFVVSPEFENSAYRFESTSWPSAMTILPRGIIEDLAVYANVSHQNDLGAVFINLVKPAHKSERIDFHLIDSPSAEAVSSAWVYRDDRIMQGVIFNVEPGRYQLVGRAESGSWVGSRVIDVYSETTTVVEQL
jgi:hypothetical protein